MLSSYVSLLRPRLKSRGATTGSWQLLSADDRETLRNVVQLMASTGVTYKPSFENANNASSTTYFQRQQFGHKFALEPNVESLTTFSFTESPKTKVQKLSEPMKKFLRREIQNAAIRGRFTSEKKSQEQQREDVEKRSKTSGWRKYITNPIIPSDQDRRVARQQSVEEAKRSSENEEKVNKSKPMNFLQRARAVAMKQKRKRLRSKSSSSQSDSISGDENKVPSAKKAKPVVIFRYEEGFSNAVRRPVTITEFLSKHDMDYAATRSPSKMF